MRIKTARWNPALPGKEWTDRGRATFPVGEDPGDPNPPPTTYTSLFAGHVPNRVLVGMAASASQRPDDNEALQIVGGSIYERRIFKPTNIDLSGLNSMLSDCDAMSAYPVTSFKETVGVISSGSANTRLNIIRDRAKQRRTEGQGGTAMPFAVGNHHEPYGDTGFTLATWAKDQIYASNYLAGWTTNANGTKGTYTAANDVSDICAWQAIMNGHCWGPKALKASAIAEAYPQLLVDTFRVNKSMLMVDCYDPNPPNNDPLNPGGYPATSDRTSKKIQAYVDWCRASNAGAIGIGEWSCTTVEDMQACWKIARDNRDIFAIFNYFNSFANSRWDWRLIPANYPAYNGTNSKGLTDQGGNSYTAQKLIYFRTIRNESTSAQYISPIGVN